MKPSGINIYTEESEIDSDTESVVLPYNPINNDITQIHTSIQNLKVDDKV